MRALRHVDVVPFVGTERDAEAEIHVARAGFVIDREHGRARRAVCTAGELISARGERAAALIESQANANAQIRIAANAGLEHVLARRAPIAQDDLGQIVVARHAGHAGTDEYAATGITEAVRVCHGHVRAPLDTDAIASGRADDEQTVHGVERNCCARRLRDRQAGDGVLKTFDGPGAAALHALNRHRASSVHQNAVLPVPIERSQRSGRHRDAHVPAPSDVKPCMRSIEPVGVDVYAGLDAEHTGVVHQDAFLLEVLDRHAVQDSAVRAAGSDAHPDVRFLLSIDRQHTAPDGCVEPRRRSTQGEADAASRRLNRHRAVRRGDGDVRGHHDWKHLCDRLTVRGIRHRCRADDLDDRAVCGIRANRLESASDGRKAAARRRGARCSPRSSCARIRTIHRIDQVNRVRTRHCVAGRARVVPANSARTTLRVRATGPRKTGARAADVTRVLTARVARTHTARIRDAFAAAGVANIARGALRVARAFAAEVRLRRSTDRAIWVIVTVSIGAAISC